MDFVFPVNGGIQTYEPALSGKDLVFANLYNLEPRRQRLYVSTLLEDFSGDLAAVNDYVVGFGYYFVTGSQFANLYAVTKKAIYWFDFAAGTFQSAAIYTYAAESAVPPSFLADRDCLYVVRYEQPVVKLSYKSATVISTMPQARYGIVFNSHAFLANIGSVGGANLTKVQWSDLEVFEDFVVDPTQSEADFFELEPGLSEITGLSLQRGSGVIYATNAIWIATYEGFPGSFRLQPLFTGIGNIYHHAVVRAKELDYFIGADNFYALNGYQLEPIGDAVWERFISEVKSEAGASVYGYLDTRATQVFWVYKKEDDSYGCVVYNYKEQKWCFRDAQNISAFIDSPRVTLRGYDVIDSYSGTFNSYSETFDDPSLFYPYAFEQLYGCFNSRRVRKMSTTRAATAELESFDFHFNTIEQTKETNRFSLDYKGTGSPTLTLQIGSRSSQSSAITWSASIQKANVDGTESFFFTTEGVGKYLRFKLALTNTGSAYVEELLLACLSVINKNNDASSR